MNPELPPDDRAELEAKVTALLLGELNAEEAAAMRRIMAQDVELAKMHERLRLTLDLVRETAATPVGELSEQPAPLKLSAARREALLAHFKTVTPKEFAAPQPRRMSRLVELAAVVAILFVLAGMLLPSLSRAKYQAVSKTLINGGTGEFQMISGHAIRGESELHGSGAPIPQAKSSLYMENLGEPAQFQTKVREVAEINENWKIAPAISMPVTTTPPANPPKTTIYTGQTEKSADASQVDQLNLKLRGVSVDKALAYLGEAEGLTINRQADTKGAGTWDSETGAGLADPSLSKEEKVALLNKTLASKGLTAVQNEDKLTVMTLQDAAYSDMVPIITYTNGAEMPQDSRIVTEVIPVHSLNPVQVTKDLYSLLPKGDKIDTSEGGNSIIMTARQADIRRMAEKIKTLDSGSSTNSNLNVALLNYADSKALAAELNEVFNTQDTNAGGGNPFASIFGRGRGGGGGESAGRVKAVSDDQNNAVLISAPPEYMPGISNVISKLDVPQDDNTQIKLFWLTNADTRDTAKELLALFPDANTLAKQSQQFGGGGLAASSSMSDQMKKQVPVNAVADPRTQSLLVTASKDTMAQIEQIVDQLDSNPSGNSTSQNALTQRAQSAAQQNSPVLYSMSPGGGGGGGGGGAGGGGGGGSSASLHAAQGQVGPVTMTVDPATGSVIYITSPENNKNVVADLRALQEGKDVGMEGGLVHTHNASEVLDFTNAFGLIGQGTAPTIGGNIAFSDGNSAPSISQNPLTSRMTTGAQSQSTTASTTLNSWTAASEMPPSGPANRNGRLEEGVDRASQDRLIGGVFSINGVYQGPTNSVASVNQDGTAEAGRFAPVQPDPANLARGGRQLAGRGRRGGGGGGGGDGAGFGGGGPRATYGREVAPMGVGSGGVGSDSIAANPSSQTNFYASQMGRNAGLASLDDYAATFVGTNSFAGGTVDNNGTLGVGGNNKSGFTNRFYYAVNDSGVDTTGKDLQKSATSYLTDDAARNRDTKSELEQVERTWLLPTTPAATPQVDRMAAGNLAELDIRKNEENRNAAEGLKHQPEMEIRMLHVDPAAFQASLGGRLAQTNELSGNSFFGGVISGTGGLNQIGNGGIGGGGIGGGGGVGAIQGGATYPIANSGTLGYLTTTNEILSDNAKITEYFGSKGVNLASNGAYSFVNPRTGDILMRGTPQDLDAVEKTLKPTELALAPSAKPAAALGNLPALGNMPVRGRFFQGTNAVVGAVTVTGAPYTGPSTLANPSGVFPGAGTPGSNPGQIAPAASDGNLTGSLNRNPARGTAAAPPINYAFGNNFSASIYALGEDESSGNSTNRPGTLTITNGPVLQSVPVTGNLFKSKQQPRPTDTLIPAAPPATLSGPKTSIRTAASSRDIAKKLLEANSAKPAAAPAEPADIHYNWTMPVEQVVNEIYAPLVGRTPLRAVAGQSAIPKDAQITLKTTSNLTKSEAIKALETELGMNGVIVVPIGDKYFKVVTDSTAARSGGVSPKTPSQQADAAPAKPSVPPPVPQPEIQTRDNAFSTFSLNVSDVSFKLAAASLQNGSLPDAATVRTEEFINAFDYRDSEPAPGAPIGFTWERAGWPFSPNRDLLRFSVKTATEGRQAGRPLNLVLLLDKSGSMERADRVAIIREALRVLAGQLQPQDTLSVVVFARTARLWADGVPGSQAGALAEALEALTPEGGTNLEEAMKLAYETALRHYLARGENRVVVLTDGAANLGNVEPDALKKRVEANRAQGISLDCFGVGWEDYNDNLLEVLSRTGGGRYGFINTPEEAATGFAGQLAGALRVAASDVKVQVEFNTNRVASWRQLGYAKDQLKKEQFRDNTVKAAQLTVAESGNALYTVEINPAGDGPLCTVHVRYRTPGTADYYEHSWDVPYTGVAAALDQSSPAMRLAGTATAFSEWLAGSPYDSGVTLDQLQGYLRGVPEFYGADARPKLLETMLREARSISGK